MLKDEMMKYSKLTGEDATHVPIIKIGAYLDGYDKGYLDGCNKGLEIVNKMRVEIDRKAELMILTLIDKYMESE